MQDGITTFKCRNGNIKALYIPQSGPLIVMIHGFPGRPQDFKRLIDHLNGHSILAVALPGFGISPKSPNITHDNLVQTLIEVIQQCSATELFVLGHSFGSALAVSIAEQLSESVIGLFLVSPVGLRPHRAMRNGARYIYPVFRYTPLYWFRRQIIPTLFRRAGFPKKITFESMWLSCRLAWAFRFNAYKLSVSRIKAPCTLIHSSNDPLIETQIITELVTAFNQAELLLFDSGKHNPHHMHAKQISQIINIKVLGR